MKRARAKQTRQRAQGPNRRTPNDRSLGLLLSLVSLAVAVTCSGNISSSPQARTPSAGAAPGENHQSAALEPGQPAQVATSEASDASVEAAPEAETPTADTPLSHFYHALRELERTHRGHVRIAWLGDSHTAADFWTDTVRARLQQRFGVGGPGFVNIGLKAYRHAQVETKVSGKWQRLPLRPARTTPFLDGVYGLAGERMVAKDRAVFHAIPRKGVVVGRAHWTFRFRPQKGSRFRVILGDVNQVVYEGELSDRGAPNGISTLSFEADPSVPLEIQQLNGEIEFFGLVLEGSGAGVVLDTLGIDGAKARTPLAWDRAAWQHELELRKPELAVFAYGTNEVFEALEPGEYAQNFRDLVGRVRSAVPGVACLMIGPTDVMKPGGGSHERVALISHVERDTAHELGCAYVGADELMGGPNSYEEWSSAKPRLAGKDGVHLTVSGYKELGSRTATFLMAGYEH